MVDIPEHLHVFDRVTDAFFAVNNEWVLTYLNNEASRLLFHGKTDLIGKCLWNEFPKALNLSFYEHYIKAIHEQVTVEFEANFPSLEKWFDVRVYPSSNGLSVYFKDITCKKRVLLRNEQHYESLFKYNPDAVFSLDLKGNYLSVNPATECLLGYREDELLHMTFIPLIPSEELDKTMNYFLEASKGITQHYETRVYHKNGKILDVKVTNMPIIVNNEPIGVYGVARDITQENKNELLLLESEQLTAVGQLAASIAHEIRNPLTSLKGFVQLIENKVPGVNKEYFSVMMEELGRIELITSELLFLAKPQAQEFKIEQMNKIIQDVVLLLGSQALINRIEIRTENLACLPAMLCIGQQLKQVFINLIKNAMEAMPGGGVIEIKASMPSTSLMLIQVVDQGKGIPKELISKIGSPFYTTKENGTGLGMMTTIKIIKSHGGNVNISSIEGQGTTIDVYLPVVSSVSTS
ncbi:Adaptive-response sensory-kinase SasA [Paenibacillus allorhizoplanae]|uniref:histidine kinase n=1 Tax=Paenibacillus allorhizoplanae TaxID=2905648 RepID=A0ABN8GYJ2_9BACL|nr:PAS domain-containing sensor histidine kinase [Paenibacillus allorhizoplanae]CAH1222261.1 Adaptive-response sensory-kinase SasA [Paenibacillus allorhizoplanae]